MSMVPYMTTYSEVSFDHDTIYDNDGIKRLVPNLFADKMISQWDTIYLRLF